MLIPILLGLYLYGGSPQPATPPQTSVKPELNSTVRNYDAQFYHLDLNIAIDSQYLDAHVLCRFKAKAAVDQITLDLSDAFKVYRVDGARNWKHKNNELTLEFGYTVPNGKVEEVTIWYKGKPAKATDGLATKLVYEKHGPDKNQPIIATLSTPYLAHMWYPCNDSPADKVDSVYVDITVKDTLINGIPVIGVSNGILQDSIIGKGKRTYQWRHHYPITSFYVLASVSNYRRVVRKYEDPFGNKFPLEYFVFDEHMKEAEVGINRVPDILDMLAQAFGPYPFAKEKFGLTQLGFYSGIETQTNPIVNNLSGKNIPTIVHEAAHQWFGCSVTCADWADAWLNEGMATYAEAMWQEFRRGGDEYMKSIKSLTVYNEGSLRLTETDNPFAVFKPIVYNKGAAVLHMLRHTMSDPYFYEMLQKYPQDPKFKYKTVTTEDFMAYCEKMSDQDLETFSKEWVYGEGYPVYYYSYLVDGTNKKLTLTINQESRKTLPKFFFMPIDVRIEYADGTNKTTSVLNNAQEQTFTLDLDDKPVSKVTLDPDNWIMKEVRYRRQVNNVKSPLLIKSLETNDIGRHIDIQYESAKSQDVEIVLIDAGGATGFSKKITKVQGASKISFDIEETVKDGPYTLKVSGKSDTYYFDHKLR